MKSTPDLLAANFPDPEPAQAEIYPRRLAITLENRMPSTHRMWLLRAVVMSVQTVERPGDFGNAKPLDLLVKVADIDSEGDGFDIRLHGAFHNIEVNDVMHLLGHELADAQYITQPRLCVNHNTGRFERVYPPASRLIYGVVPLVEHKYWLSAWTFVGAGGWLRNSWKLLAIPSLPVAALGMLLGGYVALLVAFTFLLLMGPPLLLGYCITRYLRWVTQQTPFTHEKNEPPHLILKNIRDYFCFARTDLTAIYETVALLLLDHVAKHPDYANGFVANLRGTHTNGRLG